MTASLPQASPAKTLPSSAVPVSPAIEADNWQPLWYPSTWEDYVFYRDEENPLRRRLFFDRGYLLVHDMTGEGINHANISDLFRMILAVWFLHAPEQPFSTFSGCLLEKKPLRAGAPDLILYLGEAYPVWEEGEPRRIDLGRWRVPELVGEVGDTTLATDLDEKKKLYADMGIPEYWVINVQGRQVFAFQLQADRTYQPINTSLALAGLPIGLLDQTLAKLAGGTNGEAVRWFAQQLSRLEITLEK